MLTAKEMYNIMKAHENGLPIEAQNVAETGWEDCKTPKWNWGANTYRIKMVTPVIPWDIINPKFKYFAIDVNGGMYFYTDEPFTSRDSWNVGGSAYAERVNELLNWNWVNTLPWTETLQTRPE